MFYVGQKVVCIDDSDMDLSYGEAAPKKGGHYTIREITHNGLGVKLFEIVNTCRIYRHAFTGEILICECDFYSFRFAPIEEYTDSMSIAMQLVQEIGQVDKAKNPVKAPCKEKIKEV